MGRNFSNPNLFRTNLNHTTLQFGILKNTIFIEADLSISNLSVLTIDDKELKKLETTLVFQSSKLLWCL
jgi:uncharacterized protein YjbI with pentapeptide repeats